MIEADTVDIFLFHQIKNRRNIFVVIFIDLIRNNKGKSKIIGAIGVFSAILCLIIFGADKFLIPSLLITVAILSSFKKFFDVWEVAK